MRKGLCRAATSIAFGLAAAASSLAQDAPQTTATHRHRLHECLAILNLTDAQKTGVENVLAAAKPTIQADVASVKAARQTLKTDLAATSPDACAIGADALAVRSARQTLQAERQTVLSQILAVLPSDLQSRLQGCLDAPFPDAAPDTTGAADESSD